MAWLKIGAFKIGARAGTLIAAARLAALPLAARTMQQCSAACTTDQRYRPAPRWLRKRLTKRHDGA